MTFTSFFFTSLLARAFIAGVVLLMPYCVGCGSGDTPKDPALAWADFKPSFENNRSSSTKDAGNVGSLYSYETVKKQTHERCLELARHQQRLIEASETKDYVTIQVFIKDDPKPYFRYTWKRPADAKTGDYSNYTVEENTYR